MLEPLLALSFPKVVFPESKPPCRMEYLSVKIFCWSTIQHNSMARTFLLISQLPITFMFCLI